MSFHEDTERLDYPTAERIVVKYLRRHSETKTRVTSVDVLEESDYPNDHHNRLRVHDSLKRYCVERDADWRGRTVFEIAGVPNQ